MVIVSAKISKRKVLLGLLAAVCVIALLVILVRNSDEPKQPTAPVQTDTAVSLDGSSNESRLAFLEHYGWQADSTPAQTQEVRIPKEFNDVFTHYNELQQKQGFDLSNYAGKTAKRYVYAVTNHPDGSANYYATILVHKNKIIGGDVASTAQGGSMHGFQMPG